MQLSNLLSKLGLSNKKVRDREIYQVAFWTSKTTGNLHTLYLTDTKNVTIPPSLIVIYIGQDPFEDQLSLAGDLQKVYAKISEWLVEDYAALAYRSQLEHYFSTFPTFEEIIEQISRDIHFPMVILDCNGQIMAWSSSFKKLRPYFAEQKNIGYIHLTDYQNLQEQKIFEHIRKSNKQYYIDQSGTHVWYHGAVKYRNVDLAYLSIVGKERQFSEVDLRVFSVIQTQIMRYLMTKINENDVSNVKYAYFFNGLMTKKFQDPFLLDYQLRILNWQTKKNFKLLFIAAENQTNLRLMVDLIREYFYNQKYFLYENQIIFVLNFDEEKEEDQRIFTPFFIQLLQNNQLKAAVSAEFHSLLDLWEYYKQTLTIYNVGSKMDKDQSVYPYEHYAFWLLLETIQEHLELTDYLHPAIEALRVYDKKNKSDFLETLYVYLMNPKDITRSAQVMNIHKNTFTYRLNRIKEEFHLDLGNGDTCFNLLLSIKILYFKKELPFIADYTGKFFS